MTNPDLLKKFGKRLRYLRHKREITQEQLAELADLSRNSVGMLERGKSSATIETLVSLAEALDVEVGELFKFDETPKPKGTRAKRLPDEE